MTLTTEPRRRVLPLVGTQRVRRRRIVVADDDADFRGLVADELRRGGYDVVEEKDGGRLLVRIAAIHAFGATEDPIDLIISDVRMPVLSGIDILKGLRNARRSTPFILVTGFDDADVFATAAHLGALVFQKPFEASSLRDIVRDLLLPPDTGAA